MAEEPSKISFSAADAFSVTPSDATVQGFRALYVGGAGDVAITTWAGTVVTFKAVPVGAILPIQGTKIMSTNTTATFILGLK
jgi:hypothetical protein